jgi:hypothetical protein
MTTTAVPALAPPAPAPESARVKRLRTYLQDLDASASEFRACLDELTEEDLSPFGFDYFLVNWMAVFQGAKPVSAIRELARACNLGKLRSGREGAAFLTHLSATEEWRSGDPSRMRALPRINGWDAGGGVAQVEQLLARKRGLLVTTAHFGGARYLPIDLALQGYPVSIALDTESSGQVERTLETLAIRGHSAPEEAGPGYRRVRFPGGGSMSVVDVEAPSGPLQALTRLRRNEIIFFYFDGNTGQGGAWADSNRALVRIFQYEISVKQGVAGLSAAFGTPLLPLFAFREQGALRLQAGAPLLPPQPCPPAERDRYAREATAALYAHLERLAGRFPEQWESACLLHRWRAGAPPSQPPALQADARALEQALQRDGRLRWTKSRVARIRAADGPLLVDTKELRIFRLRVREHDLTGVLYGQETLDARFLDSLGLEQHTREQLVRALARLHADGLLNMEA